MKEIEVKLIFLGQASVGKSSIISTYNDNHFSENLANTIGVAFNTKVFTQNDIKLTINIWDTCGQERFMAIAKMYYQDANVILLVMEAENESSFERAQEEYQNVLDETKDAVVFLVVNKIDLIPGYEKSRERDLMLKKMSFFDSLMEFADAKRLKTFFVSAKLEQGITEMFNEIRDLCFKGEIKGTSVGPQISNI